MSTEVGQCFDKFLAILHAVEHEQKKLFDRAIKDKEKANAAIIDAEKRIIQLRKWTEDLHRIKKEVISMLPEYKKTVEQDIHDAPTHDTPQSEPPGSENAAICDKLRVLCNAGYKLTSEEIDLFQQIRWSRDTFSINYPFARLYNHKLSFHSQLLDEYDRKRYLSEVFKIGGHYLLFSNQWFRGNREYFDSWYKNFLTRHQNDLEDVVPIKGGDDLIDIPKGFILFGKSHSVNDWRELLIKICEEMILKKPYRIARLGVNSRVDATEQPILCLDENQITGPQHKLSNGLFVDIGGLDSEIKTRFGRILSTCGYDSDVLQIS